MFMSPVALALLLGQKTPAFADSITPVRLQSHVQFLASDLLEGRGTPSRGLDLAANYIAGEFAKAGLEPGVASSYFQESEFTSRRSQETGKVRNVIGLLRGSDPKLKNSYIIVSAHYDHLGKRTGEGDTIFNGANDDASGVSGVIESAYSLAKMKPKRSIIFMCFWGEEMGLVGSTYYAKNPVFPLAQTDVMINLEQIGRTDDSEGPRVAEFNITGFDYTDLAEYLRKSAEPFGVKVTKHPKLSDPYFMASDNAALAGFGVPANTVSTAYEFPDYHQVGDEYNKLDYVNMTQIVRAVANGVFSVANSPKAVTWSSDNPRTLRYREAAKKLAGG